MRTVAETWRDEAGTGTWDVVGRRIECMVNSDNMDVLALMDGDAHGFMGIVAFDCPVTGRRMSQEHFFYIEPEHRRYETARMLIAEAEKWSKDNGCEALLITASSMAYSDFERVGKLYKRMGYDPYERTYIKEI